MPMFSSETTSDNTVETTPVEVTEEIKEPNLPKIELVVEDGTGVSDSNVYCDLDYALEYCVKKGYSDWVELTEDEQKIFLIRGTDFIDNFYEWKGVSSKGQYQFMSFPREDIFDDRGFEIKGIPDKLKKACIEAAYLNATSGSDSLFGTTDSNGKVKKQKVDSLEVEYFEGTTVDSNATLINYTSIYDILNKLLKGLYKTKGDSSKVCTRAKWVG